MGDQKDSPSKNVDQQKSAEIDLKPFIQSAKFLDSEMPPSNPSQDPLIVLPKNPLADVIFDPDFAGQNAERLKETVRKHNADLRRTLRPKPRPR